MISKRHFNFIGDIIRVEGLANLTHARLEAIWIEVNSA